MKIDAFLTPLYSETETQYNNSIVIMIDVLRASTTICTALYNGAKEVITCESTEKAVSIYSSLSRTTRFLGGERNCQKPSGFDAGNSPSEYSAEAVKGKTVIISTTNGTKLFQKAKLARMKIIGGFVNLNSVIDYINTYIENNTNINQICVFCAGTDGRLSYEDTLCAGAFICSFAETYPNSTMTDSSLAVKDLYNLHSNNIQDFLKAREHAVFLNNLGFGEDNNTALSFNIYPVVPIINGNSIKLG